MLFVTGAADITESVRYFRSDVGLGYGSGALPSRFDEPDALRWRVEMDPGRSTPILCQGKIFLTTYQATRGLAVVALDEKTGQQLWRASVPAPLIEKTHSIGSPAMATPACDGLRLFAFFGSVGLLCYDLEGNKLWNFPMGPFQDEYGAGSSPILVDGRVILNQDHDIDSFLIAIDAPTGKMLWKVARPDAVRSYATPALWLRNNRKELLVAGALELASYDPVSGDKLWASHSLARIVIPCPIPSGDKIYMASWAPGGDAGRRLALDPWPTAIGKWDKNQDGKLTMTEINDAEVLDRFFRMDLNQDKLLEAKEWERYAEVFRRAQNSVFALKPTSRGELQKTDILWQHIRGVPYVTTPLIDQGRLWMVKDGGIVTQLDAANGKMIFEERLPGLGNYYASPVASDGKVFLSSENGVLTVLANQAEWKIVSSHNFREKIYATPMIDHGRIFIRTDRACYCFQGRKIKF